MHRVGFVFLYRDNEPANERDIAVRFLFTGFECTLTSLCRPGRSLAYIPEYRKLEAIQESVAFEKQRRLPTYPGMSRVVFSRVRMLILARSAHALHLGRLIFSGVRTTPSSAASPKKSEKAMRSATSYGGNFWPCKPRDSPDLFRSSTCPIRSAAGSSGRTAVVGSTLHLRWALTRDGYDCRPSLPVSEGA